MIELIKDDSSTRRRPIPGSCIGLSFPRTVSPAIRGTEALMTLFWYLYPATSSLRCLHGTDKWSGASVGQHNRCCCCQNLNFVQGSWVVAAQCQPAPRTKIRSDCKVPPRRWSRRLAMGKASRVQPVPLIFTSTRTAKQIPDPSFPGILTDDSRSRTLRQILTTLCL